ncbi:ferritin-like domain-containing protein [Acidocella sp.]|uniref:ferritin-like domain-containing protein n=1 Tax=Acidocella sp. TaxID=50710 RepID=UPI003D07C61A
MPVPSEAAIPPFSEQIAALRDEAARRLRIRPIPPDTGLQLLRLLHRAEELSISRYAQLLEKLDEVVNETLHSTLTRRQAMERRHAAQLAGRIAALGGEVPARPELPPSEAAETLPVVVSSLLAKRGMVKLYRAAIRFLAQRDRDSAALLRLLLSEEEAHIAAMKGLVQPR